MTGRWSARCWDCSHTWVYLLNKPPMTDWAQGTIVPLQLLIAGYVPLGTCHRSDPCKLKLQRWVSKWVSSQETEQPNPEPPPSLGRGGKAWGESTMSKTLVKRQLLSYPCWETLKKPSKTSFWGTKSQLKSHHPILLTAASLQCTPLGSTIKTCRYVRHHRYLEVWKLSHHWVSSSNPLVPRRGPKTLNPSSV